MYKVLQLVCIMCILYSYFILYYTYMAKRINVYLTDDDISILWDMWWKEIVELAKKGLSGTVESSVPSVQIESSDILGILEKIYEDTQFVVQEIKNKKPSDKVESKEKQPSPEQLLRIKDAYSKYSQLFKSEKSWWTWDKMIDSTFVFTKWDNPSNRILWKDLCKLVIEDNLDWTEYITEEQYNTFNL